MILVKESRSCHGSKRKGRKRQGRTGREKREKWERKGKGNGGEGEVGKDLALKGRRGFTTCVDIYLVPHVKYVIQKLFRSSRHFADILQKVLLPILIFSFFNGTLRRLLGVRKYVFLHLCA